MMLGANMKGVHKMIRKPGLLTAQEQAFVDAMAATGDPSYSLKKAGYKGDRNASQVLKRELVQRAIVETQQARLVNEALPAAVSCILEIIRNPKAPAAARVQAAKLTFDRVLPHHADAGGKEPHEMTPEELASAIDKLESIAAGKARAIEPPTPPGDIFD
jgi:phage terminase small subunit